MTQPQVVGLIHDAHAAAAELPDDSISPAQLHSLSDRCVPWVPARDRNRLQLLGVRRSQRRHRLAVVARGQASGLELDQRAAAERTEAASGRSRRIADCAAHAAIIDVASAPAPRFRSCAPAPAASVVYVRERVAMKASPDSVGRAASIQPLMPADIT